MTIFLVGYMGSGKTTLGRQLADILGYCFKDLDQEIEIISGKSIPELFSLGEDYFRLIESETLKNICSTENMVVATGGGTPCFESNMDYMNLTGITVYLQAEKETLAERIQMSDTKRPLIAGKRLHELLDTIDLMLKNRIPYYLKAQIIVNAKTISASEIKKAIENYLVFGPR